MGKLLIRVVLSGILSIGGVLTYLRNPQIVETHTEFYIGVVIAPLLFLAGGFFLHPAADSLRGEDGGNPLRDIDERHRGLVAPLATLVALIYSASVVLFVRYLFRFPWSNTAHPVIYSYLRWFWILAIGYCTLAVLLESIGSFRSGGSQPEQ